MRMGWLGHEAASSPCDDEDKHIANMTMAKATNGRIEPPRILIFIARMVSFYRCAVNAGAP